MNKGGSKIGRKTEAAIAALLTEPTHAAAAEKAGVGLATLARWLKDPAFLAAYREARRRIVEGAIGQLQQACSEAVATLRKNLGADKAADQNRAAVAILEHSYRGIELVDLIGRMDELEALLEEVTARDEQGPVPEPECGAGEGEAPGEDQADSDG